VTPVSGKKPTGAVHQKFFLVASEDCHLTGAAHHSNAVEVTLQLRRPRVRYPLDFQPAPTEHPTPAIVTEADGLRIYAAIMSGGVCSARGAIQSRLR
jgi:hypothetical protein